MRTREVRRRMWLAVPLAILNAGYTFAYLGRYRLVGISLLISVIVPLLAIASLPAWRFGAIAIMAIVASLYVGLTVWAIWTALKTPVIERQPFWTLAALSIVLGVSFLVDPFLKPVFERHLPFRILNVPAESMSPTIIRGDGIIAKKTASSKINPGDTIIFWNARDIDSNGRPRTYVKRVVASSGQTVQMRSGKLWIDGISAHTEVLQGDFLLETLPNGASFTIRDEKPGTGFLDNTSVFEIPANHFFVMGDNRDKSADSRTDLVSYVPMENVYGVVTYIGYSWPEWKRSGQRIKQYTAQD